MKNFYIEKIEMECDICVLIVLANSNSPLLYIKEFEQVLKNQTVNGKVLVDQILHVGNTSERYISFLFKNGKILLNSMRFELVKKSSVYRVQSRHILCENNLIEYSILSNIQKRMLAKGIVI